MAGVTGTCMTIPGGSGVAGSPNVCIPKAPINCGEASCGNGTIDTCNTACGIGPCATISFTEACDGTQLGSDTCAAHGYGSGALACKNDCTIDTSACVDCATGPRIATCGDAPFAAMPGPLAIAGTSSELGIAWTGGPGASLSFVRLSSTLQLLSSTPIDDGSMMSGFRYADVRLAPLPAGWLIAASDSYQARLYALDGAGKFLGVTTLDMDATGRSPIGAAVFAPRADGGPLVVWQVGTGLRAAVVAADGRSATTPRALPFDGYGDRTTAVYAGGAFYVVTPVSSATNPWPLRMVRIETDGTVGAAAAVVDVLPGSGAANAAFVAGGDDLRLIYEAPVTSGAIDMRMYFQKVATNGAPGSDRVSLTDSYGYFRVSGAFAYGADTAAVMASSSASLGVARVGAGGQVVTPLFKIMAAPSGVAGGQLAARVGSDIVAAWYTANGIRLARVTP